MTTEEPLSELINKFATHEHETVADTLDALRKRLGQNALSTEEWNALVGAAFYNRMEAHRRSRTPPVDQDEVEKLKERLWQLHRRGVSYASGIPAVNMLLADLAEGIREAANALASGAGDVREALKKAGTRFVTLSAKAVLDGNDDLGEKIDGWVDEINAALSTDTGSQVASKLSRLDTIE